MAYTKPGSSPSVFNGSAYTQHSSEREKALQALERMKEIEKRLAPRLRTITLGSARITALPRHLRQITSQLQKPRLSDSDHILSES